MQIKDLRYEIILFTFNNENEKKNTWIEIKFLD